MKNRLPVPLSAITLSLFISFVFFFDQPAFCKEKPVQEKDIHISLLAHKGYEKGLKKWAATAEYLSKHIPGYRFKMYPKKWDEMRVECATGVADFVLCNPGMYVEFEAKHNIRRIATVMNLRMGRAYTEFGSLLLRRTDRSDLKTVYDLKGKHLIAVNETAWGGWQVGWKTLLDLDFDPYKDLGKLSFAGSHDNVIIAVRDGLADAGNIRTDALERLAAKGVVKMDDFTPLYIHPESSRNFPFMVSSKLYPEWPFSAASHVPASLVKQVALTLMQIPPDSKAARTGKYAGWTVPANYQSVHETLRKLKVTPYEDFGKFTFIDALKKFWLVTTIVFIFIVILLERSLTIRRKNLALKTTLNEVEEAKVQVEEANLKIMDSLHYSQRIQKALLPNESSLKQWLPEYFVIWQPRDLVGGDLYFAASGSEGSIAAVIDCTGHGVPGALMTMIAYSCLRTIILAEGIHNDPALILQRLNDMIKTSLKQDTSDAASDDGLDAVICFLRADQKKLVWAGARLGIYVVGCDGNLKVLKGDRQSIGYRKSDPDFRFTNQEVDIEEKTLVYLVSDGLLDQLGGTKGFPFGSRRFRDLLQRVYDLPVAEQSKELLRSLTEYRGTLPQIDDTTVFAFAANPRDREKDDNAWSV